MPITEPAEGITGAAGPAGPKGDKGDPGTNGTNGSNGAPGTPFNLGTPVAISPVFATPAQAVDNTKPAHISVMIRCAYSVVAIGTLSDVVELWIGATSSAANGGAGGIKVAQASFGVTTVLGLVGLGIVQENQLMANLPVGWYYSVRRTTGTTAAINSAVSQPLA